MSNADLIAIQGTDFKARQWMSHFPGKVQHFTSWRHLLKIATKPCRKTVIFRYQNSASNLISDLVYTVILSLVCVARSVFRIRVMWILHNIDRETVDRYPLLTRIRRSLLWTSASRIFVTDTLFKEQFFPDNDKVSAISFGAKTDGSVKAETIETLKQCRRANTLVGLCLGATGQKYLHFSRLEQLAAVARRHNLAIVFVLSRGSSVDLDNVVYIDEPNLDERAVSQYVDFIYRINDDVSMPYTIYAAASAGIPIVTASGYFTSRIVRRYGIGFTEERYFSATAGDITLCKRRQREFLESKHWGSLYRAISKNEPL